MDFEINRVAQQANAATNLMEKMSQHTIAKEHSASRTNKSSVAVPSRSEPKDLLHGKFI